MLDNNLPAGPPLSSALYLAQFSKSCTLREEGHEHLVRICTMTFKAIRTLAEILILIDGFPWNRAVYVTGEYPWETNSVAAVLDPAEIEDVKEEKN